MVLERIWPDFDADERTMLESWLEFHRTTLLMKCEGLEPDQLAARPLAPSTLSLLGLVRHMAEVERAMFQEIFEGVPSPALFSTRQHPDADFDLASPQGASAGFEILARQCEHSRAVLAATGSLEDRDPGGGITMRWILLHLIEEYARHNGHADLLRQHIDGATGS